MWWYGWRAMQRAINRPAAAATAVAAAACSSIQTLTCSYQQQLCCVKWAGGRRMLQIYLLSICCGMVKWRSEKERRCLLNSGGCLQIIWWRQWFYNHATTISLRQCLNNQTANDLRVHYIVRLPLLKEMFVGEVKNALTHARTHAHLVGGLMLLLLRLRLLPVNIIQTLAVCKGML